jgi:hypothetical protein
LQPQSKSKWFFGNFFQSCSSEKFSQKLPLCKFHLFFRFIYSFLQNTPIAEEQSIIVRRFLDQTFEQIRSHSLWKNASFFEIDAVSEVLEKYVMTKIYSSYETHSFTFF